MQIYNSHLMNSKQRFWKSFLYGFLAAIACAVVFSLFVSVTSIRFSVFYLLTGLAIAKAINKAGGGIGKKYSYMGAGLTAFSIIFTELFMYTGYGILSQPQLWFSGIRLVLNIWSSLNGTNILSVFFMIWGIYLAYTNSDIANI